GLAGAGRPPGPGPALLAPPGGRGRRSVHLPRPALHPGGGRDRPRGRAGPGRGPRAGPPADRGAGRRPAPRPGVSGVARADRGPAQPAGRRGGPGAAAGEAEGLSLEDARARLLRLAEGFKEAAWEAQLQATTRPGLLEALAERGWGGREYVKVG